MIGKITPKKNTRHMNTEEDVSCTVLETNRVNGLTFIGSFKSTIPVSFTHSHSHAYTAYTATCLSGTLTIGIYTLTFQEQFEVHYLAQGHFDPVCRGQEYSQDNCPTTRATAEM